MLLSKLFRSITQDCRGRVVANWGDFRGDLDLSEATLFSDRLAMVPWDTHAGNWIEAGGLWPAMADRFAYVPFIGLFIIIAWGTPNILAGWQHRRVVLSMVAGAAISAAMIRTWRQLHHWRNTATLFKHALEVTTDNHVAHRNFGNETGCTGYVRRGHFPF